MHYKLCTILGEIVYLSLMAMKFHCSSDKKHCFDPEELGGEGGGRGDRDEEYM